jgi:hypothetical protein
MQISTYVQICKGGILALPEFKILQIIEKERHITVKRNNLPLLKRLMKMEEEGKIEWKDTFRDCIYYGKPGELRWTLNGGFEDESEG